MAPIFPGMDPYLEGPVQWPGLHDSFITYVRETLKPLLPKRYYADIRIREEVGIAGFRPDRVIYPDAVVVTRPGESRETSAGLATMARSVTTPEHLLIAVSDPVLVSYIEIRESSPGSRLVTVIELLSPTNKVPGADRKSFERKQAEILASDVHWVEIDLLRKGQRLGGHPSVEVHSKANRYDYIVVVSRSSKRLPRLDLELYGFKIQPPLPVVGIPLIDPDPDVPLDLGHVFQRSYDSGPYDAIVRYDLPPDSPLDPEQAKWARGVIATRMGSS